MIVDQSGKLVVEDNDTHKLVWNGNAPILAGTAITVAAPSVNNDTGVHAAAGVVDLKSSKEESPKAGAVTWQKVDKNAAALTGAEFQVYEGDVSGLSADELIAKTPLKFNGANGAYSLPTANADGTYPEGATDTLQSNAEGKYTLNGLKLNTTYTVIKKCIAKGAIERREPNFMCHALNAKEVVQEAEAEELIGKLFDGSPDKLFAALLDNLKLSKEQIENLRRMVAELE